MIPEVRLFLASLLLAISEQDIRFVRWIKYANSPEKTLRMKTIISEKSKRFVGSIEFGSICSRLNIDADRMRKLDPEKAHKLFLRFVDPRRDITTNE